MTTAERPLAVICPHCSRRYPTRWAPWLKIYGNTPDKGAIISFTMDGLHPHESQRSSTVRALPCAPAIIARSR